MSGSTRKPAVAGFSFKGYAMNTETIATLKIARKVLLEWQKLYATYCNTKHFNYGSMLPPAYHVRVLESIDELLIKENPPKRV